MSVTAVTLLAIGGICCVLMVTTLLAFLRVAAHSDAQLEREGEQERELPDQRLGLAAPQDVSSTGRFTRRRERSPESGERPLVR